MFALLLVCVVPDGNAQLFANMTSTQGSIQYLAR